MYKLFIITFLSLTFSVNAQEPFYKSYNWDKNPDFSKLQVDTSQHIIAFKDKTVSEFYFIDKDALVEYFIDHQILWLNSDEVIERYNKVYLPYSSSSELLITKARVINKGKTIELDNSKVLTAVDEETKQTYKYFAFEGIEKGSFIEYYYVVKRNPQYRGKKIILQEPFNKKNVEFDLYAPNNLIFEFKTYNGLPPVEQDTLSKDKLHWKLCLASLDKLESEERAAYNSLRQYLVYKLDRNTVGNTHGISSYAKISGETYSFLFKELNKKEASAIEKLVKQAGLKEEKDDISKIRKLENYLKENFYITDINSEELGDIQSVIKSKTGNEDGMIRIYIAALQSVGIATEVVLTCDRSETKFDKQFEAGNFLTNYLLYFPSVKKFTAVDRIDSRVGFPPPQLTDNYGLFIKEVALGEYKNGVGKIRYIDAPDMEESKDIMLLNVSFDNEDPTLCKIKFDRSFCGYYASYIQPFLKLADQESLDNLYNQLIKFDNESVTIKDKTAYNAKPELFGIEPFRLTANIESTTFVDKAGNKYLFKLGELIGPQLEMYQDNDRKLPLESDFKRKYERTLTIEIPKGFKISNLESINIQHFYEKEGKKLFEFHSYYKLNNNKLVVYANEYYDLNIVGVDIFEDYRKVINSAADFNKIVLVLEPN